MEDSALITQEDARLIKWNSTLVLADDKEDKQLNNYLQESFLQNRNLAKSLYHKKKWGKIKVSNLPRKMLLFKTFSLFNFQKFTFYLIIQKL